MNNEEVIKKAIKGVAVGGMTIHTILSILFFFIGILMVIVTVISFVHNSYYVETTATIVDVKKSGNTYIPIYEYTVDGKKIRGDGFPTSDRKEIVIGRQDVINYNSKDVTKFDIGSRDSAYIIFCVGIFLIVCTIIDMINYVRLIRMKI